MLLSPLLTTPIRAGICIALIYVLRAIPRYKRVLSPEVKSAQGDLDEMSV